MRRKEYEKKWEEEEQRRRKEREEKVERKRIDDKWRRVEEIRIKKEKRAKNILFVEALGILPVIVGMWRVREKRDQP